jgi:hypothetical protein
MRATGPFKGSLAIQKRREGHFQGSPVPKVASLGTEIHDVYEIGMINWKLFSQSIRRSQSEGLLGAH